MLKDSLEDAAQQAVEDRRPRLIVTCTVLLLARGEVRREPADAVDFEARLKRARARNRPQYLYIQAYSLLESGQPAVLREAMFLADRSIAAAPPHIHESASHGLKGLCFERLGDLGSALSCYLAAVDAEKVHRGLRTDAYLDFCWAVAVHRLPERFERALLLLDEFASRRVFPIQRFRGHGARAFVAKSMGQHALAQEEATLALQEADIHHSGLAHHPTIGLVHDKFESARRQLSMLAAAG